MKKHVIMSLLLLAGAFAGAAPLTVAVYDFTDADKNPGGYGGKVTTLVTADLTTETNLVMLERAELNKALGEQAFGISGLVSADAAAKIGQITGAKVLVAGQVIQIDGNHLVIVANIIGTETGRLFAAKVEGATDNLMSLTTDLSRKIAETVTAEATNLAITTESHDDLIQRIISSITYTNRPAVSVDMLLPTGKGAHSRTAEAEFGMLLLKAGFTVVDANSDRKPNIEITGIVDVGPGPRHGALYTDRAIIELKIQERRTGGIRNFDHQESAATDISEHGADRQAQVNAVDALAERVFPILGQ